MGIKGVYGEIGPGERIALSKLSIEKYEKTGLPLRIAIDVAIWQFQAQTVRGGSALATRTLYYRLLRLLSSTVQPLFVFDGPNKPTFKRNRRIGSSGCGSSYNLLTKQLLKHFGFPSHDAPGEAEAECALLQKKGIVDAVLSEDVDTIMFGSTLCLRNWSSEGTRGNKAPTHVSAYYSKNIKEGKSGLDREGMILVALMSGGDYITEGVPGFGIKSACKAARAGFGKSLCAIARSDTAGYKAWREKLAYEITTDASRLFRTKRKMFELPKEFPNLEVLGYYTHPVVSSTSRIQKLENEIKWDGEVDVMGLRRFVAEHFDWTHKTGAIRFIRGLAPALLVHKLRLRGKEEDPGHDDLTLTAMYEAEIVQSICGRRIHFSTDGIPELRLIYRPLDIVAFDLDAEDDSLNEISRDGLAPRNDEAEFEAYVSDHDEISKSLSKKSQSAYDPSQPDKLWVARTIARIGVPLKVEDYEESLRSNTKTLGTVISAKKTLPIKSKDQSLGVKKSVKNDGSLPHTKLGQTVSHLQPCLSSELDAKKQLKTTKRETLMKSKARNNEKFASAQNSRTSDQPDDYQSAPTGFTKTTRTRRENDLSPLFKVPSPIHDLVSSSPLLPVSSFPPSKYPRSAPLNPSPVFPNDGKFPKSGLGARKNQDKRFDERTRLPLLESSLTKPGPQEKLLSNIKNNPGKTHGCEDSLEILDQGSISCMAHLPEQSSPKLSGSKPMTKSYGFHNVDTPDLVFKKKRKNKDQNSIITPQRRQLPIMVSSSPLSSDYLQFPAYSTNHHETETESASHSLPSDFSKTSSEAPPMGDSIRTASRPHLPSQRHPKKVIILRDSLPGGWKMINENEDQIVSGSKGSKEKQLGDTRTRKPVRDDSKWRMSEVEIMDLTAS